MDDSELRLECLRLALLSIETIEEALRKADVMADFVLYSKVTQAERKGKRKESK